MKKLLLTVAGLALLAASPLKAEEKAQTTCPVMGGTVDRSLYVDVEGKRIYVCCSGCISAIKEDPKKYIKKLRKEGVKLENAPQKHGSKSGHEQSHKH